MFNSIKYRCFAILEILNPLLKLSNDGVLDSSFGVNCGKIGVIQSNVLYRFDCECALIDTGFMLVGSSGTIYGRFSDYSIDFEDDLRYLSLCSNAKYYRLVFKNIEDYKKVKNILTEMVIL